MTKLKMTKNTTVGVDNAHLYHFSITYISLSSKIKELSLVATENHSSPFFWRHVYIRSHLSRYAGPSPTPYRCSPHSSLPQRPRTISLTTLTPGRLPTPSLYPVGGGRGCQGAPTLPWKRWLLVGGLQPLRLCRSRKHKIC